MKVLIVGAGKLGTKLAESILNAGIHVTIIDSNTEVLNKLKDHLDVLTVNSNGARIEVLKALNIETYDLSIIVTSSDEVNMVIGAMVKALGCKRSIARIRNPEYADQLEFIKETYNINHIINPELATANEILRYLMEEYSFYFGGYVQDKVSLVSFNIKNLKHFVNKPVSKIKDMNDLLIVAISRQGDIIVPHGGTVIKEDDSIYVIGERDKMKVVSKLVKSNLPQKAIKKVMVLGGSRLGYYLADALSKRKISVKLIEANKDRCQELADTLNDQVIVIHGNGTDVNLLDEEGIKEMDAFIGVTGFDEENLFMSLRAKQLNVSKVIAKISRQSYVHVIEKLGIDLAINPVNITASEILKYIRGGQVISVSLLLDGQAEVAEIIASEDLEILNKPIKNLNLPKGLIVAAIVHNGKVTIPNGNSLIRAGDRIVVFTLLSQVRALQTFFKLKEGN